MTTKRMGVLGRIARRGGLLAVFAAIVLAAASADAAGFGRKGSGRKGSSSGGSSGSSSGDTSSSSSSSGGFGRRSSSGGSSGSSGGRNVAVVTPRYGGPGQTVVARPTPRRSGGYYRPVDPYRPHVHVGVGWYDPFWGPWTAGYYTSWGVYPWGHYSYGYYPLRAAPPPADTGPAAPSIASMSLIGGLVLSNVGPMPYATTHLDVGPVGLSGKAMGLVSAPVNGQPAELMPYWSGHFTWSLVSEPSARVRLEGGLAGILAPDVSYVGPDVGASAQLALAGPLGFEGSVHWMPFPASVVDAQANVALNLGGLTLRFGWRTMVLDDTGIAAEGDGGIDVLNGPQASVGLVF